MSILWTLRKFIDPIEHREKDAAQKRDRKMAQRQGLGARDEDGALNSASKERKIFECRVCGHRSRDTHYCSECLAETMVELKEEE